MQSKDQHVFLVNHWVEHCAVVLQQFPAVHHLDRRKFLQMRPFILEESDFVRVDQVSALLVHLHRLHLGLSVGIEVLHHVELALFVQVVGSVHLCELQPCPLSEGGGEVLVQVQVPCGGRCS